MTQAPSNPVVRDCERYFFIHRADSCILLDVIESRRVYVPVLYKTAQTKVDEVQPKYLWINKKILSCRNIEML